MAFDGGRLAVVIHAVDEGVGGNAVEQQRRDQEKGQRSYAHNYRISSAGMSSQTNPRESDT
jgi:hypothetical protein